MARKPGAPATLDARHGTVAGVAGVTAARSVRGVEAALAGGGGYARIRLASGVRRRLASIAGNRASSAGASLPAPVRLLVPMFRVRLATTAPEWGWSPFIMYPWKEAR